MLNKLKLDKELAEHELLAGQDKMSLLESFTGDTKTQEIMLSNELTKKELEILELELAIDIMQLLK